MLLFSIPFSSPFHNYWLSARSFAFLICICRCPFLEDMQIERCVIIMMWSSTSIIYCPLFNKYACYLSNKPQISMVYRPINPAGCWKNTRRIRKSRAEGDWFTNSSTVLPTALVVYQPINHKNVWSIALLQKTREISMGLPAQQTIADWPIRARALIWRPIKLYSLHALFKYDVT